MQNSAHLAVLISAIIPLISIVSFEADGAELNCLGGKFDRIERSISTPTKNALIRLKLRHSFVNELRGGQPTEKRSFEYKSIFNQTGRADPSKIRNETVTEALFQLTTRIFSPKTGSLPNYYEVLGVDKKATLKQIRDGYYKAAKQWHPDKNKKDPQAEARFKLISEAYEVLGDPEKRKIYDEGGREGLEAHELFKNIDVKAIIRALFGGGEFEDIIGDVCELPMLKHVLRSEEDKEERTYREEKEEMEDEAVESKGGKKDRNVTEDELEKLAAKEEEYCKMLGEKLYNTLRARADAGVSSDDFIKECKEWGRKLCEAPGGMDLVLMLSTVWKIKGKSYQRRLWGLDSILCEVRDLVSRVTQAASLLRGFLRASRMTQQAIQNKTSKTPAPPPAPAAPPAASSPGAREEEGVEPGVESMQDEEATEVELAEEDMKNIAKAGLDVVWRLGLFLLQERARRVVREMMKTVALNEGKARCKDYGRALWEAGDAFKAAWRDASQSLQGGIPLRFEEAQGAQTKSGVRG